MRGINILGLLTGLFLLTQSYLLVKRREESVLNFLIWSILGTGLVVAAIFPGVFDYIIELLGMEERAFAMFAIGIFILYVMGFSLFQQIKKLEASISRMNEEISLLSWKFENSRPTESPDADAPPEHRETE